MAASPSDTHRYNAKIEDLDFDHPPVIVGNKEDAAYRQLLDSLEKEPAPWDLLCEAIRCGNEEMVRAESIHFEGVLTITAKREAILAGRPDFLRILLERDNHIEDYIVAIACERRDRPSVRALLDFGWPINQPVCFMASLLSIAVDDADFMQWLLEAGADVNARSKLNESALSVAISHGTMDVVRLLLAQGTDVTHGDLLHCAAERDSQSEGAELVRGLIAKGADVNAYRYNNAVAFKWRGMSTLPTPLHVACRRRNIPVAEALLQHGADPHRKMFEAGILVEPTSLDKALESKDQDLLHLMRRYLSQDRTSL